MKLKELYRRAEADIRDGKYGPSGSRFPSVEEVARIYETSYVTAHRLIGELLERYMLVKLGNRSFVMNGMASRSSELYATVCGDGKTTRLGIIAPSFVNPYFAEIVEKLAHELAAHGFDADIKLAVEDDERPTLVEFIRDGCMGVFSFVKHEDRETVDLYRRFPLPIVIIGKSVSGLSLPCVKSDNFGAGYSAACHLIACGYKRFACVNSQATSASSARLEGFRSGLVRNGFSLPHENVLFIEHEKPNSANNMLAALFPHGSPRTDVDGPLGIFCHHDLVAMALLVAMHKNSISVPDEVGVIGYDNLNVIPPFDVRLTTFAYSFSKIADTALNLMREKLDDENAPPREVKVQTMLLIRTSTAPISDTAAVKIPSPDADIVRDDYHSFDD